MMRSEQKTPGETGSQQPESAKRAYVAPVLSELGSVEELTRGGAGISSDFRLGRKKT